MTAINEKKKRTKASSPAALFTHSRCYLAVIQIFKMVRVFFFGVGGTRGGEDSAAFSEVNFHKSLRLIQLLQSGEDGASVLSKHSMDLVFLTWRRLV